MADLFAHPILWPLLWPLACFLVLVVVLLVLDWMQERESRSDDA